MPASLYSNTVCAESIVVKTVHAWRLCGTRLDCSRGIRRDSGRGLFVNAGCVAYRSSREPKSVLFAEPETVLY